MESGSLVTIAVFVTPVEASVARGYLEANGMPAFLADENITRIAGHLIPIIGGIKLQVRRADEYRARDLLAQCDADAS